MTLKSIVFSSVAFGVVAVASAAPFDRWFEHRMTDGRTIRIHGVGDEYAARFTDEQGRNLVYNPQAGAYEYAEREDDETFRRRALERRLKAEEETGLARRWAELKARRRRGSGPRLMSPPSSPTVGTIVGVTLLVDFPVLDEHGVETNTLAACVHPGVTASDLNDLINGTNFRKYGNASSVREYFHDASSGHLDYTNVVIGWIKAPHPREYYDDGTKSCGDCGRALIGDVFDVLKADQSYATEYLPRIMQATTNADGEFLALNVFFAGNATAGWGAGLWAHQSSLEPDQYDKLMITIGGKSCHFNQYQISPVTADPSIGTFCHESGHMICDFPDLYAYPSSDNGLAGGTGGGVRTWCLMCEPSSKTPQNFCAYLRAAAGWVKPKELPPSGLVTVTADLQDVWKYSASAEPKQYYLIENRQASGRDQVLRAPGIVIYRCDEFGSNPYGAKLNDYGVFYDDVSRKADLRIGYEVSVEQADGLYSIEMSYLDDANDSWFLGNSAVGYTGRFNSTTLPAACWSNGRPAKLNLSQFSANGPTMTFYCEECPANDDWGNVSWFLEGTMTGVNSNATVHVDEPLREIISETAHTLWWRWRPDEACNATFSSVGSQRDDGSALNTILGVFTRSDEMFSTITYNDDVSEADPTSSVTFMATPERIYYICVGGRRRAEVGEVKLHLDIGRLNDDFKDALAIIERDSYSTSSHVTWWTVAEWNTNATVQANEPLLQYNQNTSHTLWWRWTAREDCKATFRTLGSKDISGNDLDTLMGIYTYANGAFTIVDENDDADENSGQTSSITFVATAGETYYICVGGYGSSGTGEIHLSWMIGPKNDDFEYANYIFYDGHFYNTGSLTAVNTNATVEADEPLLQHTGAHHTLWWTLTPDVNRTLTFDTVGSVNDFGDPLDTILGVYTISSGGTFSTIAENDEMDDGDDVSSVTFAATAGVTYYVCVGTANSSQLGAIQLNWTSSHPRPANDDWENAISISGGSGTVSFQNIGATMQDGEPLPKFDSSATDTVWWKWTTTERCTVTFDTIGSTIEQGDAMYTFLGVYTRPAGQFVTTCQNASIWDDGNLIVSHVTFTAWAGETYYICVSSANGATGTVQLNWAATPSNDLWNTAPAIYGTSGTVSCENAGMTAQADDPLADYLERQGGTAARTAWWTWTAPETGEVVFDTIGSCDSDGEHAMDTALGIYTYSYEPRPHLRVAENNDLGDDVRSRVRFSASAGTTYYICVATVIYGEDAISAPTGEIRLNWNMVKGISGGSSCATDTVSPSVSTLWWAWTAPSDGRVTFDTTGSQLSGGRMMDTILCICTNAAMSASSGDGLVKVAENDNINLRTTSSVTFMAEAGKKYYILVENRDSSETGRVWLNWGAPSPSGESVDLASVTSFDTTIADGTTIYGTVGGYYKVSIAAGATVTISNATINGVNIADFQWAGLTCEGDATLVLEGANTVKGFYSIFPGIYVPFGSRLDIGGSGSLTASSNGRGAGIGGCSYMDCGDIYIHGGTITATGGEGSAGIGGGDGARCGNIVIDGGLVAATGGDHAAGIGSGFYGSCGAIGIGSGIDCVVATHGAIVLDFVSCNSIGAGASASCGAVTVAQGLTDTTIGATRMIAQPWDGNLSTLSVHMAIATNGTIVTGTLGINSKVCVAPGATVTLRDATIDGVDRADYPWAGITCLGDATIVLEGANAVMGFDRAYPGIYVPEGSTLVIRGPGSLAARSNSAGAGGAGIGGGREIPCGSIVIEGGTIAADGSCGDNLPLGGAGIGGGLQSRCGDITILGGDVTATGGGEAAGIGGGYSNKGCGAVTIGSHVTRVFAKRGVTISQSHLPADPIGAGSLGSAVSVTLGPGLFDDPDGDWRRIRPWNGDLSVLDARNCDIIAADGTTIHGTMSGSHRVSIAAGATVTLSNAVVAGATGADSPWAGIACLGDATIVLEGDSSVRGFYEGGSGVQVPSGSTLAITGGGSLTARGNGAAGVAGSVAADDGLSDTVSGSTRTFRWNGDLSKLKGNAVATNGMTIRGALDGAYRVSIADGATVTLRDATIEGANSASCPWAGITCEGDATIVLEGANVVRGFHEDHPGIYVPVIRTLTIRGTGSLAASSNGKAAGIGGGNGGDLHCGDICIQGGMIVATGGVNSAGIGGGNGTDCWNISITGGDVTATGGANAAGIGAGGGGSSCHAIEVGPYITRVVATCGEGCSPVDGLTPGAVTVHDSLGNELDGRTRTISIPVWDGNLAGLVRDVTAVNGTVITGALPDEWDSYHKVSIAPGATVTLSNATIYTERTQNDGSYSWAGITCLGDATIVLADASTNNIVRGFHQNYPGIHVPDGSTLTIRGGGPLEAYSGGSAAGIGGGYGIPCGDIVIEGGDIEAWGGQYAAAIGGGNGTYCGDITIGPGITRVVTVRSSVSGTTIGAGSGGTCGGIVLDGLRDDHGATTRTLLPPWDGNLAGLTDKDVVTARDGMVLYGTNCEGKVSIAAGATVTLSNAACRANSAFPGSGWAGLACDGDAMIVLVGDNDIRGFNSYAFGIEVPAGCTLSVQGAGSLNASGSSAGIGGGGTVVVASGLSDTGDGATRTIRPWEWDGNLSALDRDVTAQDGMTLYGTLQGYYKVSVAAGATVTLSNAVISLAQRQDCKWAGVSCIGDARIVLADASTNTVKGCHIYYPGIHVPVGSTLAIAGRGVLNASSNGRGAGIGGGWNVSCGSIVIEGGTVNAGGGTYCAGIGGGYPYQIAVTCGSITIGNGIAKIVATGGFVAEGVYAASIGAGHNSTCGTVTIHPDLIDDRRSPTRTLVSGGMSYDAWARRSGYGGAWDAVNTSRGTYNVFLYAFGITPYSPFTLLDITFDEQGRAVVKTPPLKNNVGFMFEVGASDNPDGTGNVVTYALDPSGETVIDETNKTKRFFRLRATER